MTTLSVFQMSFLARTLSQVVKRSGTTTALLLQPRHAIASNFRLASTQTGQKNKINHYDINIYSIFPHIDTDKQQKKYEYLLVDIKGQCSNVALIQLNRPKALNALCGGLMKEVRTMIAYVYKLLFFQLSEVLQSFDQDDKIGCIVLTGSSRAFAGKLYYSLLR